MTWDPHLLGHVGSRPIFLTGSDGLQDRISAVLGPGRTWLHEPVLTGLDQPKERLTTIDRRIISTPGYVVPHCSNNILTVGIRVSPLRSPATAMAEPW
ncbi:hypothetical protein GQ457_05G020300 [Hibiscus cannabinus]